MEEEVVKEAVVEEEVAEEEVDHQDNNLQPHSSPWQMGTEDLLEKNR